MDFALTTRPYGSWVLDFEKRYPPGEQWLAAPRFDGTYEAPGLQVQFASNGDVELNNMRSVQNELGGGWRVERRRKGLLFGPKRPMLSIETRLWTFEGPIAHDRLFLTCIRMGAGRTDRERIAATQVIARFTSES